MMRLFIGSLQDIKKTNYFLLGSREKKVLAKTF